MEDLVTDLAVAQIFTIRRTGLDCVCTCGRFESIQERRCSDCRHVDEIGHSLYVLEEAHAPTIQLMFLSIDLSVDTIMKDKPVSAINLGNERSMEGDDDSKREHNALECAADSLTGHGAVAVLHHHAELALVNVGGKVTTAPVVISQSFHIHSA